MDNRVFKIRHATERKKINAKYPECDDDDETLKKGNEERKFKIRFLVLLIFYHLTLSLQASTLTSSRA